MEIEKKKKVGAPKKHRGKKNRVVKIRMSSDDERILRELSEDTGLNKSDILRRSLCVVIHDIKKGDDVFGLNKELEDKMNEKG